jgi:predicted phosphoribosyltransferase
VSLVTDEAFMAVGTYYDDFSPVPDAKVVAMLEGTRRPLVPGHASHPEGE